MRTFNSTDFVNIIREGVTPLSLSGFHETKQIGNLWDKLEPDDKIGRASCRERV